MANKVFEKQFENYTFVVFDEKPDFPVYEVNQVHGNEVVETSDNIQSADGIVANLDFNKPLAIKTADCLPIAIFGKNGVSMVHAGWRGVASEIILNQKIKDIEPELFIIGPHIQEDVYEVSEEFTESFQNSDSFSKKDGKIYFSLFKEISKQILESYPEVFIFDCALCTFKDDRFHSYRLNKTTKRNWNVLLKNNMGEK